MIEPQLRSRAVAWQRDGRGAVVVEVIDARGSAPRGVGTRMLVAADEFAGTIGGGHLELKAVTMARAMLGGRGPGRTTRAGLVSVDVVRPIRDVPIAAARSTHTHTASFALGPSLGQCCGGAVTLGFAPLDEASLAAWPTTEPLFHLQLHGAGHVGRAIATLLATLDVSVDWFDERDDGFPAFNTLGAPWPAHIRRVDADTVEAEVRHAPPGAFYLVLTHEHALDLRIIDAVLTRGDAAFAGLIGSKTKRASFEHRLEARGVSPKAIAALRCPIGIDGIDGSEPEVIAFAVVAEMMRFAAALRNANSRSKTGLAVD